jgi:hypothetical protein
MGFFVFSFFFCVENGHAKADAEDEGVSHYVPIRDEE